MLQLAIVRRPSDHIFNNGIFSLSMPLLRPASPVKDGRRPGGLHVHGARNSISVPPRELKRGK
jgi:hypothetical protein